MLEHPEYYERREDMIRFLEEQDHKKLREDVARHESNKRVSEDQQVGSESQVTQLV